LGLLQVNRIIKSHNLAAQFKAAAMLQTGQKENVVSSNQLSWVDGVYYDRGISNYSRDLAILSCQQIRSLDHTVCKSLYRRILFVLYASFLS